MGRRGLIVGLTAWTVLGSIGSMLLFHPGVLTCLAPTPTCIELVEEARRASIYPLNVALVVLAGWVLILAASVWMRRQRGGL